MMSWTRPAKLICLTIFLCINSMVWSQFVEQIYSYETDIAYPKPVLYTDAGFALFPIEPGFDDILVLRNDNVVIWDTELEPVDDHVNDLYEHETGFYYTGEGGGTAFGRLNKISGNIEVSRDYSDFTGEKGLVVNSTFGGNFMIGGYFYDQTGHAVLRVVTPLGDPLTVMNSSASGELWGHNIYQIERTLDNGYILAGVIYEDVNCQNGEISNASLWLCKMDAALNIEWSQKFGNGNGSIVRTRASDNYGPEIIITSDNEIVVLGQTFCTDGNGGGPEDIGDGTFLMKVDEFGDVTHLELIDYEIFGYPTTFTGIANSCGDAFVLSGISSAFQGNQYFVEKYTNDVTLVERIFSGTSDFLNYWNVDVVLGKNKTYLLHGNYSYYDNEGNYHATDFITKTSADAACANCENLPLDEVLYSDCENFNLLDVGNISPQGNPRFTLFSGNSSEQAFVVANAPDNGTNALSFGNSSDIDYNIGRTISTPARLEWRTYIPQNSTGSWGLETVENSAYALSVDYVDGEAELFTGSTSLGTYGYPEEGWFTTAIVLNPDQNTIQLWVNGELIHELTNFTSNQITDLNLYYLNGSVDNEFYIDDLIYYEVNEECNSGGSGEVVCVNNQEFESEGDALCAGYSPNEWTVGSCCEVPTEVTISAGGSTSLCPGETVTLTASNICPGCEVVWNTGDFALSIMVSDAGTYSATVFNDCGETAGSNLISVLNLPEPVVLTINADGPTSLCNGESVTLSATNACNNCIVTWSNGSTGTSIVVSTDGTYTAIASNTCGQSPVSNAIDVSTNAAPSAPVIAANGPTALCNGASVTLSATNVCTTCTVLWSNGQTGSSVVISSAGTFTATVSNSCGTSIASNAITITTGGDFVPVVQVNDTCHFAAPAGSNYQWLLNGNIIPQATGQFYTATASGYYAVTMTNNAGCTGTSEPVYAACVSAITDLRELMPVHIYPNPAHNQITVDFGNSEVLHHVTMNLYSVHGLHLEQLWKEDVVSIAQKRTVSLGHLPAGMYVYRIYCEEGATVGSLVIAR